MKTKSPPHLPEPTEAEIQHTAYLLWHEGGRVPGRDLENWLAAKELLRHRPARSGGKRKPAGKIPPAIPASP